jgi:hypothetical protein
MPTYNLKLLIYSDYIPIVVGSKLKTNMFGGIQFAYQCPIGEIKPMAFSVLTGIPFNNVST